jgi:LuxR family maltose regulon positive regulatory protein
MLGIARAGAGEYEGAIQAYERGIEPARRAGNLVGVNVFTYGRAMYLIVQGRLNEAEQACRSTLERAAREGHAELPALGWPHVALARIELERWRLDEAQACLDRGLRIARHAGFGEMMRVVRYLGAHLQAARGDAEGALAAFQDVERIVNALDDPYASGELAWEWTAVCLKVGRWEAARSKLALLEEMAAATGHANLLLWRDALAAGLLCGEGRHVEALVELDAAIGRARATRSSGQLIRLLAQRAVALAATGRLDAARSALREALELGAPEGFVRRWVDVGPAIAPLLRDLRERADTPETLHAYLDALLDACRTAFGTPAPKTEAPPADTPAGTPTGMPVGEMLDPLTPRELEVTRLICQGHSNAEIARRLVVAVSTVKKHTSHIYDKLGVRSRAQAIARAHELGLV